MLKLQPQRIETADCTVHVIYKTHVGSNTELK